MKRICGILGMICVGVLSAAAQDRLTVDDATIDAYKTKVVAQAELQAVQESLKLAKVYSVGGAVMGPAVKNAPYSAVEVNETTQKLADGTRIHRESQTSVYRDSEGRVRRETPEQVTIWDPVANASFSLNPKAQTARKMPLRSTLSLTMNGSPNGTFISTGTIVGAQNWAFQPFQIRLSEGGVLLEGGRGGRGPGPQIVGGRGPKAGASESLGKQLIEGVPSDGTRVSSTIETGVIGNDRPLHIVSESWYSSELQTLVKSVHTDPQTGEEVFRLTNVSRVEPPSTLFQVPAEYQILGTK